MTAHEKPDASAIRAHLNALKNAEWLSPAQKWWPRFLFHFTDVQNAVNILRSGELLCRTQAAACGLMVTNGASPEIISRTKERWKDYVRLYFRPRTPTQYNNEGFRPPEQRKLGGAHCPFPITADGSKYFWENTEYIANDTLRLDLTNLSNPTDYSIRFLLNGDLAFASRHQEESSLPF